MVLVHIIHDKGEWLPIVDPSAQAIRIENSPPQIALFSKQILQHVEQMPFFENTKMFRRYEQVLDHILTMEIMNFIQRQTITTENAWATRPLLPLGFTGGEGYINSECDRYIKS